MRDLKPCGTTAAYARHLKAGERPCDACREAAWRDRAERRGDGSRVLDRRASRNGLPGFQPFQWRPTSGRARRAEAAGRAADAAWLADVSQRRWPSKINGTSTGENQP